MPGESKLTRRQLALLLWGAMLSPLVRRLPGAAGRGAWLAALLALPPALLLGSLLGRMLSRRRPGEGLGELFLRAAGPVPGRIAAGLFGLWFLFYGGFVLRAGADRFVSAVYTDSPVWPFLAVTGLLGLLVGVGRLKTLARVAEAAAPPLAGLFALVIALSPETVEPAELWPLSADDVHQALLVEPLEKVIDIICDELKLRHVSRLQSGKCTINVGFVFNDLITNFERISAHCSNIAIYTLKADNPSYMPHEYSSNAEESTGYTEAFLRYTEDYVSDL